MPNFFRYGLPAKTLQENLPNRHEVLLFQGVGTERHGKGKEVIPMALWNRMSSGSYMPVPAREVLINKEDGSKRVLGSPTVLDRVAQEVIRQELEKIAEPHFSANSFGYRPGKSQHMAVAQCQVNCQKYNWAIDLDIKGFFDNIDHRLLIRAVKRFTTSKHILMYVKRWLNAPIQKRDGSLEPKQGKGTPQGAKATLRTLTTFL